MPVLKVTALLVGLCMGQYCALSLGAIADCSQSEDRQQQQAKRSEAGNDTSAAGNQLIEASQWQDCAVFPEQSSLEAGESFGSQHRIEKLSGHLDSADLLQSWTAGPNADEATGELPRRHSLVTMSHKSSQALSGELAQLDTCSPSLHGGNGFLRRALNENDFSAQGNHTRWPVSGID